MVCFEILLSYPIHRRKLVNEISDVRMNHLFKHAGASCLEKVETERYRLYRVSVCDMDAHTLLRYSPEGMGCLWIRFLYSQALLYANAKTTDLWIRPPRDLLLKRVYWAASKLEKASLDFPERRHMAE